jgi:hypothetical protein
MRADIKPWKAAAKHLDIEVTASQIRLVDVGDLELAEPAPCATH